MKLFLATISLFAAIASAADAPVALSASDLASRLSAGLEDGNSFVRVRLDVKGAGDITLQLQIKQRRVKNSTEVLYQVLWPKW